MDDPLSSPEQKPVKITYSSRQKRRSNVVNYAEDTSEEEESGKANGGEKRTEAGEGQCSSKIPKPTTMNDAMLPPPDPQQGKSDATAMKKPVSKTKGKPDSTASSISNAQDETKLSPNTKPLSAVGLKGMKSQLTARRQTPDSLADDRSSTGESSKLGARVRKTEAERKEFLENDPFSGEVESHRMFCTACKEWIQLNPTRKYIMRLWLIHRKQCGKQARDNEKNDMNAEQRADDEDHVASVAPSEKDGPKSHRSSATPSARVATAERKLKLVNDTQVKTFTPTSVDCALCATTVTLSEGDYNLTEWDNHKLICSSKSAVTASAEEAPVPPATPPKAQGATRAPPSTPSTVEASPSRTGEKRPREDDEDAEERCVRPRTTLYRAPEGDSPGFLDWIMLPFRNFVRGFREGLSD